MSAELPTAAEFFKCCRESFASNRALNAVFAAVSRGDIRTLLRYVREYLTSRHLDTKKIVEKYRSSSGYRLAEHEAIRALLYGEYRDYDPSQSAFPNLFDVEHADGAEHFARMCGLHCLERQTDTAPNHGFVPADAAIEYLNLVGFGDSTARNTVSWMLKSKCAEDRFGESAEQSQPDEIRITSLGRFLLSNLAGSFAYIDAIIVDTPICDDSVRAKIVDAAAIRGRIERGKIFGDYLEKCSAQLRDNEARQCWARIKSALDADIRRAEESLGRGQ